MQVSHFEPWLDEAVAEVLESMCFMTAESVAVKEEEGAPDTWVRYRLEFRGPGQGRFGVRAPLPTARLIACNLLGTEPEELTEAQASESMGEIANMVCGSLLSRLEKEQAFDLSHPAHETDPVAEPDAGCDRATRYYALQEGTLVVWMEIYQS
jgi:CheY-specific phosphatase CheX